MEMAILLTLNISNILTNAFVKPELVMHLSNLEFAEYQKSPEKVKQPEPAPVPVDLGREWNSRLRLYLWAQLRKLYEAYVHGKNLTVNDQNLRGLIRAILGEVS